jgi:uncharacterized damage-inducible protein DinB
MQTTDIGALFDYLYWRRDRVLAGADALGAEAFAATAGAASRDLRGTLVHELDVERSWRLRLAGAPEADWDQTLQDRDYPAVGGLREHWDRDETDMRAWIAGLSDADLAAPVTLNRLDGFALEAYLVHVVTHALQSFGEAGVLLAAVGHSVGDVDFLDFYDERERPGA